MSQHSDSLAPNFKLVSTGITLYLLVMAGIVFYLLMGGR